MTGATASLSAPGKRKESFGSGLFRNISQSKTGECPQMFNSERTIQNKLYNFLSRSRSRSRTNDRSDQNPKPVHPSSKPATRSQSRPFSSTTVNTHSTITSLPPTLGRQSRHPRPEPIAVLSPSHSRDQNYPRPPHSAPPRTKLQILFGITSRPTSPSPSRAPSKGKASVSKFWPSSRKSSIDVPRTVPSVVQIPPTPARPTTTPRPKHPPERGRLSPLFGNSKSARVGSPSEMSISTARRVKKSRHGSFDFERPVSGSVLSRSGESLHTNTSTTTATARGNLQKNTSLLRRQGPSFDPVPPSPLTPNHTGGSSNAHSTANGTARAGTSIGWNKPRPGGFVHGAFSFEPPVPSVQENGGVGGRGRSMDLGLGLAWAPTRLREEAVMPSFRRSNSRGRGHGRVVPLEEGRNVYPKSRVGSGVTEVFRSVLGEAGFATFKKYVRKFDAQAIPFDGPAGLVTRVDRLLQAAPGLGVQEKRDLLDSFVQIVLQNS